ncbi:membrane protein insertion efficiency factor YidD [bacterium]|nr:membrane protein insertion efficiency factor YidD [bacterium]
MPHPPSPAARLATWLIRAYQVTLGAHFGGRCRFTPSCSDYAVEAIDKKGIVRGSAQAIRRIAKCGPWHAGGYDPVK